MTMQGHYTKGVLGRLLPRTVDSLSLPSAVPDGINREFREAEVCGSVEAWRGGSALLRSTLEKTLRANGYEKGNLAERIDQAAADGVEAGLERRSVVAEEEPESILHIDRLAASRRLEGRGEHQDFARILV